MINCGDFFRALADESRQKLLKILEKKERNVSEIAQILKTSQPNVSHHLSILKTLGLVNKKRNGQEIYYSFNKDSFRKCCGNLFSLFECCKDFSKKYNSGRKRTSPKKRGGLK